jgi:hypothetical protein
MRRAAVRLCSLLVLGMCAADAHPVAQGAMEIKAEVDRIEIVAHVSSEQVFVAEALANNPSAATSEEVWQRHGDYLLEHLFVESDGARLTGKVESFTGTTATEQIVYRLRFEVPPSPTPRRSVILSQNVLNEFNFAPGNPWEATYVIRLISGKSPSEGLLLTSRAPLAFQLNARTFELITSSTSRNSTVSVFLEHGIGHILGGYDHLLFIAALVLAVVSFWDLVKVVTAFTLAHTLTLTLAVLDVVRLSDRIVEPMIAASIVFVACQNVLAPSHARGSVRLAIAFGFGLFHGLGFAGGLLSAMEGFQTATIATAIFAFSVGVEIGHQIVALPLFAAMRFARAKAAPDDRSGSLHIWMSRLGSGAIGVVGAVYLVAALAWLR